VKSFAIKALMLGAVLAAWYAPACGEDVALTFPNLVGDAETEREPRVARAPEPVPLPPISDPFKDDELTLAEAEALATAFHPALREAEARVRAAHGNWVQVGLRPNPAIGYDGTDLGDSGTAGKQGGFISQEFVTGGKLDLNRAVALRGQAAAEQRSEQARLQVITTVRKYFLKVWRPSEP
jgi:cobalt-zinc-cadmium efflux system outer membrane protein